MSIGDIGAGLYTGVAMLVGLARPAFDRYRPGPPMLASVPMPTSNSPSHNNRAMTLRADAPSVRMKKLTAEGRIDALSLAQELFALDESAPQDKGLQ